MPVGRRDWSAVSSPRLLIIISMAIHQGAPRSLVKRLRVDLRATCGADAPDVLHLWAEANAPQSGMTLRARVAKGATDRIAVVSLTVWDWEEAYQQLLADCLRDCQPEEIRN